MSRCYPYRPTTASSARSGAGGEAALIETIKLQSEKEKLQTVIRKEQRKESPKTDPRKEQKTETRKEQRKVNSKTDPRKEQRREKKEKRKERKEKEKDEKCYLNGGCLEKGREDEGTERLEKSGITDEHNEPAQNLCYLSDGTQGSKKRKRHPSSDGITPSNGITVHRNIIRIRLPSQKCRQQEDAEPSCSTSGRAADFLDRQKESHITNNIDWQKERQRTNNIDVELTGPSEDAEFVAHCTHGNELQMKESVCITAHGNELQGKESLRKSSHGNELQGNETLRKTSYGNELQGQESLYKLLIEDWVPLPLQAELNDSDDQDWLFGTKQRTNVSKRLEGGYDISSRQSLSLWPTADYFPDAGVCALPYTIPF